MSNFWKDMHIVHPDSNTHTTNVRNIIISKTTPVPPLVPSETLVFDDHPANEEVCEFINAHNCTNAGTIERISTEFIKNMLTTDTIILCLRYQKTGKIMGILFSTMLPLQTKISQTVVTIPHAYTYFLCVHAKLRGKAVAMALIRELINLKHKIDYYCGYHIVDKIHTANYIPVTSWFRPINFGSAKANGFSFLSKKRANDKTDFRDQLYYSIPNFGNLPNSVSVEKGFPDSETLLDVHTLTTKCGYDLAYIPNVQWYNLFDTYHVRKNGTLVGIFSLQLVHPYNVDLKVNTTVIKMVLINGTDIQTTLMCATYVAKHSYKDVDVLYGYKIGGITDEHIQAIHAGPTTAVRYLEFYNNSMQVTDNQISVPII